eukprot:CAMPEP_0119006660 /NCGR_PEP_ID=MMETSP1176-20130426/2445_1 /TAXON_ID=265551 /ORGANISM="Synedropsis recta cf, Strain CCMP1620" /LENGTH=350 /DNA_ID=CAMNT_0006958611 /DNA_START=73 /DNA_END=1122 /DNA_ORIENTATION=-
MPASSPVSPTNVRISYIAHKFKRNKTTTTNNNDNQTTCMGFPNNQTTNHTDRHDASAFEICEEPEPSHNEEEDAGNAGNGTAAGSCGMTDTEIESNWEETIETFDGLDVPEELLRGIYAYGFEKPSAIQQRAIKPAMLGRDLIAQAQSGTGKTATFAISTLATLDTSLRECQSLIVAPTRELALQINNIVTALGDYMDVTVHLCVGGKAVRDDIRTLQGGVHIVVGTPGRVLDMIKRRALRLDSIRQFFLDEADEMLSQGFRDQIYDIFQFLPESAQICLFSATMPLDVLEVTQRFMRNPVRILVKKDELTLQGIKQFYIAVGREDWKLETLCDLYGSLTITQAIIYCNT